MRKRPGRRGMTLVEIMISLVLLGIVSGVLMRVIFRQQRFYQGVNQIMTQRSQLRQATAVLPIDLRSVSSSGADILVASDSSIWFDVNIGTSFVCEVTANNKIALPPQNLTKGYTFTTFYGYGEPSSTAISQGVTVYVYNDSSTVGNEDDRWKKYELVAVTTPASPCAASPFTLITDAAKNRYVLQLSDPEGHTDPVTGGPISQYIGTGAPVRLMKRVRYKLYQETDGQWYLGFSEWDKMHSAFTDLSPVSGPYEPYSSSSGTPTGIGFRYYTVDDVEVVSGADSAGRASIARIDLNARARTASNVRAAGIQNGVSQQYRDSLAVSVMLRNRQ